MVASMRTRLLEFKAHAAPARSLAFHPSASALASGGYDRGLKVWNVEDGTLEADFGDQDDYGAVGSLLSKWRQVGRESLLAARNQDLVVAVSGGDLYVVRPPWLRGTDCLPARWARHSSRQVRIVW